MPSEKISAGDFAVKKAALLDAIETYQADRLQTQVETARGELVLRIAFSRSLGNIFSVYRSQTLELENIAGHTIASMLRLPEVQYHEVRKCIGDIAYEIIGRIKKYLDAWVIADAEAGRIHDGTNNNFYQRNSRIT